MLVNKVSFQRRQQRRLFILVFTMGLLPCCFVAAVALGVINISFVTVLLSLLGFEHGTPQERLIVQDIRFPRAALAALVGAVLSLSGAVTQGLFRNPLADPSLIGVTAGASAGGSLMIVLTAGALSSSLFGNYALSIISLGAFIGGMLSVWLVYKFSTSVYGTSVATMLLAGIALTAATNSITSFLEFLSDDVLLRQISLWRMGGLDGANYPRLFIALIVFVPIFIFLPRLSRALNALLLGESEARHLGIDVDAVKVKIIFWVALGVGVSVALAGVITFVGLIIPHMMRLLIGPDHTYLLPASALAGAILLLLSDIFSRLVLAPTEIPVGLVTALIGAPVFVWILRQQYGHNS